MNSPNPPNNDRVGNDFHEGPTPNPGGETDMDERTVPPYDDRSTGDDEVAAGVPRAMGSEEPLKEPTQPGRDTPHGDEEAQEPPPGVGESISRRGEDVRDRDSLEQGRKDTGTDDSPAERPTGQSDLRDRSGVNPDDADTDRPS
ncbi:MAG: hypothetical protein H0U77_04840 [Nocardioidaceae bacterium]|nr:hypothetical protein [Nocardioidaceae bacterium]